MTALHTLDILSISFMIVTWNGLMVKRCALSRVKLWNFLPFYVFETISCAVQRQVWCTILYNEKAYSTSVQIHIMARTTQLSKDKRPSILTLRQEGQ